MSAAAKVKVLVLDADNVSLQSTERVLRPNFTVVTLRGPGDVALALATHVDAKLFIMSVYKGSDALGVLNAVRRARPKMLRFLLTGFEDLSVVVEGLHDGSVQRVLSKPLMFADLLAALPRPDAPAAAIVGSHAS